MPPSLGAHRQEGGVKPAGLEGGFQVVHRRSAADLDAEGADAIDLCRYHLAWEPIGGYPVPHHPTWER